MSDCILKVENLQTHFFTRRGVVKAVDGVSFTLRKGGTLGLVGESGCGKSMTCLSILRLVPRPGKIVGGKVLLQDKDLLLSSEREMQAYRGKAISMILQDPMSSLDPVFSIGSQVAEPFVFHQGVGGSDLKERVLRMLKMVRIPSPELRVRDYPHQFSGGMRQRVVAAMAIACKPEVLIADEPTTALDATIEAQILRLLRDIRSQTGAALILVSHNLGIVARLCDAVAVMYAGRIVEYGDLEAVFDSPAHPYTAALLGSIPRVGQKARRLVTIDGQPPLLVDMPPGCSFAPRCNRRVDVCQHQYPDEVLVGPDHSARCWSPCNGR